jgi:Zn-dependent protease with chaperone function
MAVAVTVIALTALAALLIVPAPIALARARWVRREPRAALVLWQALGLSAGLAAVGAGLAVALAPLGGDLPRALLTWLTSVADAAPRAGLDLVHSVLLVAALALLCWLLGVTGTSTWRTWRSRRRHRELVDLVGQPWPGPRDAGPPSPARIIEHPAAAAYCLPGHESRVVVTTGALDLLRPDELDAVLAHENAHLVERHDLVILPFTAWASALPALVGPRHARKAVGRLVEMVADDRACVGRERHVLAAALARVGAAGAPAGALGIGARASGEDAAVLDRVHRLLDPPRPSRLARAGAYLTAAALLALPTTALIVL